MCIHIYIYIIVYVYGPIFSPPTHRYKVININPNEMLSEISSNLAIPNWGTNWGTTLKWILLASSFYLHIPIKISPWLLVSSPQFSPLKNPKKIPSKKTIPILILHIFQFKIFHIHRFPQWNLHFPMVFPWFYPPVHWEFAAVAPAAPPSRDFRAPARRQPGSGRAPAHPARMEGRLRGAENFAFCWEIWIYIYIYIYVCVCMCVYIYIYIYTYIVSIFIFLFIHSFIDLFIDLFI